MFSLLVCDTQIAAWTSHRVHFKILFVAMLEASAKPKREWSVNTTGSPEYECAGQLHFPGLKRLDANGPELS